MAAWAVTQTDRFKAWEEALSDEIFEPLGMANSSSDMRSLQEANDVAYLHVVMNGTIVAVPMDWKYMENVYLSAPVGGVNSNIQDMAKWIILQMNNGTYQGKQIISKGSIEYTQSPKTIIVPGVYYGLGWMYNEYNPYPIIAHSEIHWAIPPRSPSCPRPR